MVGRRVVARTLSRVPRRVWSAGALVAWAVGAGVVVAACIIEGCTINHVVRDQDSIAFVLDQDHPVATASLRVTLPAESNSEDLRFGAAQLTSTLDAPADVTLTLVRDSTGVPLSTISGRGGADLALDDCAPAVVCELALTAVVEWTHPTGSSAVSATWSIDAAVTYPTRPDRCGPPPGAKIEISSGRPDARSAVVRGALDPRTSDVAELIQHITIRFDGTAGSPAPRWPVVARGRLAVTDADDTPEPTTGPIPAVWMRLTPDDGGPPIVDGPVKVTFPEFLPASAAFPILSSCESGPCVEGYWVQILAYDPNGRSPEGTAYAPFQWAMDASVSYPEDVEAPPDAGLSITTEPAAAGNPAPASLVLQGSGGSFHLDDGHPVKTVVTTANVGPRASLPGLSDPLTEASILIRVTTRADPITETGTRWLSNGHLIGDGIAPRDEDTGGWAQNGERGFAPAKPFRACAGATDPCSAQTGLVIRRYNSANLDREPDADEFTVDWRWTVFGAPPGATVDVVVVDGATLKAKGGGSAPDAILLATVALAAIAILVLARRARVRRGDASG